MLIIIEVSTYISAYNQIIIVGKKYPSLVLEHSIKGLNLFKIMKIFVKYYINVF